MHKQATNHEVKDGCKSSQKYTTGRWIPDYEKGFIPTSIAHQIKVICNTKAAKHLSNKEIATAFNVSHETVRLIRNGRTWEWL